MIENVHSHEGEEQNQTGYKYQFKPPKNIKQIGESTSQKKIYVEDYVFTYVKELVKKEYAGCRIAVLLGHYIKMPETKIIVINGAIEAVDVHFDSENVFTNDTWTSIYETIKAYFTDVEVVGWFIGGPGFLLDHMDKLKKIHLDNFAGVDKTLLKYDSIEGEEAFYIYEHNDLEKQKGYYIYFEKNDEMQAYLMEHPNTERKESEVRQETAVREFKEEIKEQKAEQNNRSVMHLVYAAGSLVVVLVIAIATTLINNDKKLQELENTVNSISSNLYAASNDNQDSAAETTDGTMDVETISGNLNSVKEEEVVGDEAGQETGQEETKDSEDEANETKEETDVESDKAEDSKQEAEDSKSEEEVKQTTAEPKYYTVEQGDTLASICMKLYGSTENVKKIMELNGIEDADTIYYGYQLLVP